MRQVSGFRRFTGFGEHLDMAFAPFCTILAPFWRHLGSILRPGGFLGGNFGSIGRLGRFLKRLGRHFGASWAFLGGQVAEKGATGCSKAPKMKPK